MGLGTDKTKLNIRVIKAIRGFMPGWWMFVAGCEGSVSTDCCFTEDSNGYVRRFVSLLNSYIYNNAYKKALTRNAEQCDECPSKMDMWQTQFIEDGYDYIEWICQNDKCNTREYEYLYNADESVHALLLR